MAIAAFVFWLCTAAAGGYLLASSTRLRAARRPAEDEEASSRIAVAQASPGTATAAPRRAKDRFDPPSLTRAKNEPLPGLRALAEFTHPALAVIGLGLWLAYVMSGDRMFAAIGFGVLLGAICAGLTWAASNARAARRLSDASSAGDSGDAAAPGSDALSFPPRLLILHVTGAAVTLLVTALVVARA